MRRVLLGQNLLCLWLIIDEVSSPNVTYTSVATQICRVDKLTKTRLKHLQSLFILQVLRERVL